MSTITYSPRLFIESNAIIIQKLVNTAQKVRDFKVSITGSAGKLNDAIHRANLEGGDDIKKDLRECRSSLLKTTASSATFVDRFNKLLRYADIDDSWKTKMIDTASRGDYNSFSAYITQIKRYLEQCNQAYQDFVQACATAEAQCRGIPSTFAPRIIAVSQQPQLQQHGVTVCIGLLVGCGAVFVLKLLNFKTSTSFIVGLVAFALFTAIKHFICSDNPPKPSLKIQYQGYDAMRECASVVNSSSREIRQSLMSLSMEGEARLQVKVNASSFGLALSNFFEEVKRARNIVNPCYEELNTGITVTEVNNYYN